VTVRVKDVRKPRARRHHLRQDLQASFQSSYLSPKTSANQEIQEDKA
jgi:hypothetical protein